MKKLILLSLLIFGCLTNYAQIYEVTFHKPVSTGKYHHNKRETFWSGYYEYTINNKFIYKEERKLHEIDDYIIYTNEQPETIEYYVRISIGRNQQHLDPERSWTRKFDQNPIESDTALTYDDGYYIYYSHQDISYEELEFNCEQAGTSFCKEDYPYLSFTNTLKVPYYAKVYLATTDNPNERHDLNIKLSKNAIGFSVSAIDIFNVIGYNKAFDIYIIFYKNNYDGTDRPFSTYKIHFDGLKKPVPFDKPYILDDHLIIPNIDTGINSKCNFILSGKTISQDVNPNKQLIPTGQYQLQISDKNEEYCQINLDAYVPFIEYKFLDGDTHTHWHSEDTIQAINLKIYNVDNESLKDYITITDTYPQNSNHFFKCKPDNTTIEEELSYYKEHIK